MDAALFAALAEPNRLRIVELLDEAPRPVGEIATSLGLRQPQVTKHLQALQAVGLVRVHALGRRRIYALLRTHIDELQSWAAAMAADRPSEQALIRYERAVSAETQRLTSDSGPRLERVRRTVAAAPTEVWLAWTDSSRARRWWSPPHFSVAECTLDPVAGGAIVLVLAEGDGTMHRARGRFTELQPHDHLAFELSPEDHEGRPLFRVRHTVRFQPSGDRTTVKLTVRATDPTPESAPALAGLRMGWEQLLDNLVAYLSGDRER
jgi:uncharacterized protein YndB with AHSA1/START domain/DNA-binding MarR family transcriptional regulator